MASYLRPRRGKKATALSQNITLKAGEVFFENREQCRRDRVCIQFLYYE